MICKKCEQDKPEQSFDVDSTKPRGYRAQCKECRRTKTEPSPDKSPSDYQSMSPWATDLEREYLDTMLLHEGLDGAAAALGMTTRRLRGALSELERRAARSGWAPASDMTKPQPTGFHVKGVSSYYGADGELKGQWVKTNKNQEHRLAELADAVQSLAEPFRGLADPVPVPGAFDDDLLCVYPMGDPHVGLYSWAQETGENFDLEIAERDLVAAVDHLVALAPPAREGLLIELGDFYHADNQQNRTARSGHSLDVDGRWSKVLAVGIRIMRRAIDRMLEKHETVRVIIEIGNHDDQSSIMLALCLANYYEREPRVVIDTSPAKFHWHRFGKNLIGVTHGDTLKASALPGVMACDRAKDWGETEHRYWYCGHVHHESVKEYPGCTVETFRTLAAKDAWHTAAGYRSGQDMRLDIMHREHGRINRHIVGLKQIHAKHRRS